MQLASPFRRVAKLHTARLDFALRVLHCRKLDRRQSPYQPASEHSPAYSLPFIEENQECPQLEQIVQPF
jgi:hypothetical protein